MVKELDRAKGCYQSWMADNFTVLQGKILLAEIQSSFAGLLCKRRNAFDCLGM